jgi:3-isopropylmalate/(R)-2-methylmalate dehydratase large subunit
MAKNIIEKIWASHEVLKNPGHPAVLAVDLMLIHEVTSAQAFHTLEKKKLKVFNPHRLIATLDHSIPTRKDRHIFHNPIAQKQVETLRENCLKNKIPLLDFESGHQGIVHVTGPELGLSQPGMTIVCGDSHTATHGAFGALAFGIGTSEVAHVLAFGCLLQHPPQTMKIEFKGTLSPGVFAKDVVLKLISSIGVQGARGYIIEYVGEAIGNMSMEERMTLCNMSIECGARAGLISPDDKTIDYLKNRPHSPKGKDFEKSCACWQKLASEPNASFDREIQIDLRNLKPMITWGTNPEQSINIGEHIPLLDQLPPEKRDSAQDALKYIQLEAGQAVEGIPIDWAFIGSCTNGRLDDLRIAAQILKGKKINPHVTLYVVPGSEKVLQSAKEEGLVEIFEKSGASFRMPGCSLCLAMNDDSVPRGKRCISSTNRNFMGRQGPGSLTHLASPATVAASALEGKITNPKKYLLKG